MALLLVSREGEGVWNPKLAPEELLIGADFGVFSLFDRVMGEPGLLLGSADGVSRGRSPLVVGVMVGRGRFSSIFSGVIVGECKAEQFALLGTCSALDSWPTFSLALSASSLSGATISFPARLPSGSS